MLGSVLKASCALLHVFGACFWRGMRSEVRGVASFPFALVRELVVGEQKKPVIRATRFCVLAGIDPKGEA
jgi:hypothetical protein